ncbi:capping complex subunit for YIEGIA [Virgibacillus alimentarius]|uniref:Uncharacterized protein n=1 Tax=Virgibacillus alimentarius TaxID=698769 RepID=A0ABS4S876_9BACI|nr:MULTISPECIES: hypothetical protein [Virgibacillus]MBP2257266.1 hypothetical protein [Virgibacillus alimentarius]HLR67352.1 hypothetical protein [Virgibacillus sp.]
MAEIVAVVTLNPDQISGGVPIFVAENKEEREKVAFSLEKIMDASAHDLVNGSIILVDHKAKTK